MQHNEVLVQEPAQKRRQGSLKKDEKVRHYYTDFFYLCLCVSEYMCMCGRPKEAWHILDMGLQTLVRGPIYYMAAGSKFWS